MKKTSYYQAVYQRSGYMTTIILQIAREFMSWPSLILSVFLRRDMGRRHFSLMSCIFIFILLGLIPYVIAYFQAHGYYGSGQGNVWVRNLPWYLFDFAFMGFSIYRYREIGALGSVFDYEHFSLSHGEPLSIFYRLEEKGLTVNPRRIAVVYEPLAVIIIGLIFSFMGQAVGLLLIICGLCYAFGNQISYKMGDNFILDKIDEAICNEEVSAEFLEQKREGQKRGFEFYGFRPNNPDLRRKVVDSLNNEEAAEAF